MPLPLLIAFAIFLFAIGLCVGSFLNVVIWRLPNHGHEVLYLNKRGPLTLNWPPSHCPVCDAPIRWFQNIPILSYLFLKARCANCQTHIPIRYPLIELATALIFLGLYLAYFAAGWQPGFTTLELQWPPFLLHLIFIAALLAASAIDADLFIIPLSIPWLLMLLGLIAAALLGPPIIPNKFPMPALVPPLTDATWWLAKPIAGGALGLILSNILLATKIMPRSFSEETMLKHQMDSQSQATKSAESSSPTQSSVLSPQHSSPQLPPLPSLTRYAPAVISVLIILILLAVAWVALSAKSASLLTIIAAIIIFLIGVLPRDPGQQDVTDEVMEEISVPFVRREILKELPFLLVPILCAILAHLLPFQLPYSPILARILGCLLGILVGGGIVWLIRIGGTLAFNKEAMGMGDAHLMAGVGAILGAPLVLIAFLTAPFLGILWAIVLLILKKPNILPYGPWLSIASILCLVVGNPLFAWYLFLFR